MNNKKVSLKYGKLLRNGEVFCDVFLQGINVSDYFHDFNKYK